VVSVAQSKGRLSACQAVSVSHMKPKAKMGPHSAPQLDVRLLSDADRARFWRWVDRASDECWFWKGSLLRRYGCFYFGGKSHKAHRVSFALAFGVAPAGMLIRHRCDNPACVNPNHLDAGTSRENVFDRVSRGRSADTSGENHPLAKLSTDAVLRMRERRRAGETLASLAFGFGVSEAHVSRICRGENWRHC